MWQCEKSESACARGERSNVPWNPRATRTSAAQHSQLAPQRIAETPAAAAAQLALAPLSLRLRRQPVWRPALRQ